MPKRVEINQIKGKLWFCYKKVRKYYKVKKIREIEPIFLTFFIWSLAQESTVALDLQVSEIAI